MKTTVHTNLVLISPYVHYCLWVEGLHLEGIPVCFKRNFHFFPILPHITGTTLSTCKEVISMKKSAEKFGPCKVSSHHVTEHILCVTGGSYIGFICEKRWWKTGTFFSWQ